jgi:hypothetical protein
MATSWVLPNDTVRRRLIMDVVVADKRRGHELIFRYVTDLAAL